MFSMSNRDLENLLWDFLVASLWYLLGKSLRGDLRESLCDALRGSLQSVYKDVEYV